MGTPTYLECPRDPVLRVGTESGLHKIVSDPPLDRPAPVTGWVRTTQVIVCNHTAPQLASIGGDIYVVLRVRAGIVLYIVPLDSGGNHNASPRREGLERRNLASRSLLRACFGPINVEFRGGAICEAYRGRPAGLARSRHFVVHCAVDCTASIAGGLISFDIDASLIYMP